MKKIMMAVVCAAMVAATAGCQLCDEPKPEVYSRSFVGMDKATVMFEWAKAWQAWPKMSGLPWPVFVIDGKTNQGMPLQLLDGNDDAAIRTSIDKALSGGVFKDAQSMESFMIRRTCIIMAVSVVETFSSRLAPPMPAVPMGFIWAEATPSGRPSPRAL